MWWNMALLNWVGSWAGIHSAESPLSKLGVGLWILGEDLGVVGPKVEGTS
ncbi:hypothetical protein RND81_04G097400 [Saponaria officinalis]|uniref:Uncharacterized protein n=1 Tax=Saponaria officinalis TaxID=3572 RepID=A0AAW1LKE0_SAPOF